LEFRKFSNPSLKSSTPKTKSPQIIDLQELVTVWHGTTCTTSFSADFYRFLSGVIKIQPLNRNYQLIIVIRIKIRQNKQIKFVNPGINFLQCTHKYIAAKLQRFYSNLFCDFRWKQSGAITKSCILVTILIVENGLQTKNFFVNINVASNHFFLTELAFCPFPAVFSPDTGYIKHPSHSFVNILYEKTSTGIKD
jgi:hypothetical protein